MEILEGRPDDDTDGCGLRETPVTELRQSCKAGTGSAFVFGLSREISGGRRASILSAIFMREVILSCMAEGGGGIDSG